MRKLLFLALVLATFTPSCTKKKSDLTRRVTPPIAATLDKAPDIKAPDVVTDTPAIVEEESAPKVAPTRRVRKPIRVAMAPKLEPTPVYIIDEPGNTTRFESEIVEPESVGGGVMTLDTEIPVSSRITAKALFGTSVDLQTSGVQEAQFGIGMEFPLTQSARVGFAQTFRKLFAPGANLTGDKDVLAEDTRLYFEQLVARSSPAAEVKLNVGMTLPISRRSVRSNNVTRVNVGLTATGIWFGGDLVVSATPDFEYFFNDNEANQSGRPVSRLAVGQGVSVDWNMFTAFHWVTWGKGYFRVYESDNAALGRFPGPSSSFGLGSYVAYDFGLGVMLRAGVLRSTTMFDDVRSTDTYFDVAPSTRFFMALSASL